MSTNSHLNNFDEQKFLIIAWCFLALSCRKEKEQLEAPQPIIDLISSFYSTGCRCDPTIGQYLWRDKTIFLLTFRGPACDWYPGYYDEKGIEVKMEPTYQLSQFLREGRLVRKVWSCNEVAEN